jgi:hypothetical protein
MVSAGLHMHCKAAADMNESSFIYKRKSIRHSGLEKQHPKLFAECLGTKDANIELLIFIVTFIKINKDTLAY